MIALPGLHPAYEQHIPILLQYIKVKGRDGCIWNAV